VVGGCKDGEHSPKIGIVSLVTIGIGGADSVETIHSAFTKEVDPMLKEFVREEKGLFKKRGRRGFGLFIILGLLFSSVALGAEFPSKSIQIIVPYQPGGPTDTTSRILSKRLSDLLGQQVIVVNKAGGGTAIGVQSALTAAADGYTILSAELSIIMLPLLTKGVGFSVKDFIPINLATSAPLSMIVKKEAPWKSFEDVVAEAKKNPDKITFSTAGPGSIARFAGELFQMDTGTRITHVPMSGAAPAVTAVLGSQVNMSFMGFQVIKSHLEAGTLRALAVLYRKRLKEFPDLPTTAEKGYPNLTATVWTGYFLHKKTPQPIVKKLGEVFNEVLKEKEILGLCDQAGLLVENMRLEEAAKFVEAEEKKWGEVAKVANIVPK
jgi:tripartite-type tricarboxylate transporter receptor subunit TctC